MPPPEAQAGLGRLQLQLPPESGAPAAVRRALRSLPLGPRTEDVVLLASELVTNAVLHADSGEPIEVTAECRPDGTWVEVRDRGRGLESPALRPGCGLHILSVTSDRWGIMRDGGTTVWFEVW